MKLTLTILLSLWTFTSFSQNQLSLLDCVKIAIDNSLELKQAENQLSTSKIDLKQSQLSRLPNINSSLSNRFNFGRSLDITTYSFQTQNTITGSVGANANATLFAGNQINNTIKLNKLAVNRNETSIKSQKDDLAIQVANIYLNALIAQEQIKVIENLVAMRQNDADRNQQLIDAGVAAGSTQVDMQSQLANGEFQLQQARNAYESALLQLKQMMYVDFDESFDVVAPNIAFPSLEYVEEQLNPEAVYQGALVNLNIIQLANQDLDIAEVNKKIAFSNHFPTISLSGALDSYTSDQARKILDQQIGFEQIPVQGLPGGNNAYINFPVSNAIYDPNYSTRKQLKDNFTQNIGVSISIPIFNQGQINAAVKKAEVNINQAEVNTKIQERQLQQTIQSAYLDATLAYRAYESARLQLESVTQSAEFAKKRLEIGTANIYDYFMAQNNLASAQVELTKAKYDYLYKVKILEFYKENQLEF